MNDLAKIPQQPQSAGSSGASALTLELAKMLVIVAPITMTTEQREIWLRGAVDALEGIHAHEVRDISAELRRKVTRHAQIVPTIAELVAQKRARAERSTVERSPYFAEREINAKAQAMRAKATCQQDIEDAWKWERDERIAAGLDVMPIAKPLTRGEIANLSPAMVKMGLTCGALVERDGEIVNAQ